MPCFDGACEDVAGRMTSHGPGCAARCRGQDADDPVIQAFAIYLAALTMTVNLVVDVLYKVVDPRVVLK